MPPALLLLKVDSARDDVVRFLQTPAETDIGSKAYFSTLVEHIQIAA